jgi:leucyl aminopeptidase
VEQPMAIEFEATKDVPTGVDAVVVPVCSDRIDSADLDVEFLKARSFEGRTGQVVTLPGRGRQPATVVVGVGPSAKVGANTLRRAAADAGRSARRHRYLASHLLGAYQYGRYQSKPETVELARVAVISSGGRRNQAALDLGARIAGGVTLARDLVNEPGGSLTPSALAEAAVEIAEREGLQISVMDETDIAAAGLGGLLGVNRGSSQPPRFIEISYAPAKPQGHLALVGKGITFDSGGLSMKSPSAMLGMKNDMGGAAAILGAFSVMTAVAPAARVTGYIPTTDNMTGPDATRPGDVLKIRNGKTVEVLNTDAEGRLVLADGLSLASEAKPDAILDLATLTGAVIVALGHRIAGLMGNRDSWVDQIRDAADLVGERVWPLPLPDDYRSLLDSDLADIGNVSASSNPGAGSITAGLFLREFVGAGIPWAHLDIAGAAWSGDAEGELCKGGTGFGVRTLVELASNFQKPA